MAASAGSNTYLTGNKVQPVAFSGDLSRVCVGGNGVIFVIDTLSFKLLETIKIDSGKNITSLVSAGNLLLIGEAQSMGSGASNNRLLVMDINPGSQRDNEAVSRKNTGIESSPLGVSGMTVGPDGRTLVVATPKNRNSVSLGDPAKRGDVLVKQDGVEYAIVSDDNYNFLDPYWKAMFEAPDFVQLTPSGPPTRLAAAPAPRRWPSAASWVL